MQIVQLALKLSVIFPYALAELNVVKFVRLVRWEATCRTRVVNVWSRAALKSPGNVVVFTHICSSLLCYCFWLYKPILYTIRCQCHSMCPFVTFIVFIYLVHIDRTSVVCWSRLWRHQRCLLSPSVSTHRTLWQTSVWRMWWLERAGYGNKTRWTINPQTS